MIASADAALYGVLLLDLLLRSKDCKSEKNSQFAFNRYSRSKPALRYTAILAGLSTEPHVHGENLASGTAFHSEGILLCFYLMWVHQACLASTNLHLHCLAVSLCFSSSILICFLVSISSFTSSAAAQVLRSCASPSYHIILPSLLTPN